MESIENQFIVPEDKYTGNVKGLAIRAIKFGRVTESGKIVLDVDNLSKDDALRLCLVLRFIAHEFKEEIVSAVRPVELTGVLNQRIEAIGAGLSKLSKNGFAKKIGRGQYIIHHYKIDEFLTDLEDQQSQSGQTKNSTKKSGNGHSTVSTKQLTGVGLDIQMLIDNGFLDKPRLMSDIIDELKKESRYHSDRVVDKTVRDSFVKNRRSLKRIENNNGGKARWVYVVRKSQ
ncbi:MAG: hypothetical protein A2458_00370 [Candidatus Kerfeldbacteria bacterium RIFOXYC2_FULL_38_9]|uniref:Uncharacterized protein n=1 Tax=Candidatus Kerfeldbacteria bacterium RIFOXYB2_FULL_38_14 TaxID=1798547 RepID=A0A1G2BAI5_9BACT|nr:MAG: hypothetical protein A2319_02535 [Candidatus Kerfeldbacteria bacterium RIFOXYB2_FULL_38_14]OGY89332.1 MAG: hypothetical protein A2458_00370 [Candidatus Kerfeldbacteria bacterium RIFOXYC2_FULL_38_9]